MFGLTQSEFIFLNENLIRILKKNNCKIYIFGSRATATHKKFSDIDLTYIENPDQPVNTKIISNILTFFEDSQFVYKIDLVKFEELSASYLPNIKKQMVEI